MLLILVLLLVAPSSGWPATLLDDRDRKDATLGQYNATLIVGTGRAGTSFLVALLTRLGLPTGFTNADVDKTLLHTAAHAGLEHYPRMMNNTIQCSTKLQIFKSPRLTEPEKVAQWINARNIQMVVIPMRKPEDSAESRSFRSSHGDPHRGGFRHATDNTSQMIYNNHVIANMLWMLSHASAIPVVMLSLPEHALDSNYAYAQLKSLLAPHGVSRERFAAEHANLSHPEFVQSFHQRK